MRLSLLALVVFILLAGCGPSTPVYDEHTVAQAQTVAQMEKLLQQMQSSLQQSPDNSQLSQQIQQLQQKLARTLAGKFRQESERERTGGHIPIQRLEQGLPLAERLQQLDSAQAADFSNWLKKEREKSELALADQQLALQQTDPILLKKRLQLLAGLENLAGQRMELMQEDVENQYVAAIRQQVTQLMEQYQYPAAEELLAAALKELPTHPQLQYLHKQAQAALLANAFEQALEDGQPRQAMEQLYKLVELGEAGQSAVQKLGTQVTALAQYHADRGQSAIQAENWAEAWQHYQTARKILQIANQSPGRAQSWEAPLRKALQTLAVRANQEGLPGLQLTYLLMLQQIQPQPEAMEAKIQRPAQATLNQAIHRLSISPFKSTPEHQGLGAALAARLTSELLQRIPHDVRVVERDELEAIIRERALDTSKNSRSMSIAPADFLVQGNILDASVEHSEKQSFQTERVQTGTREVPNPAWQAWRDDRKRKKLPEPPKTLQQPIFEDVRYAITLHKNTAVLSASYRLIDAASAKIIKTSTISREKTLTDISSEGVQLGSYNKPLKIADLPSDSEMLKELLQEVANAMSEELVAALSESEKGHLEKARLQAERGNYAEAAELAARAWVIARAKGKAVDAIYDEMVRYALLAGI